MLPYNKNLKTFGRNLRKNLTSAEKLLWEKVRKKQILGVQFYRQKPIYNYIADFYAPSVNLIIELDGQHHEMNENKLNDITRDTALSQLNLTVLRFNNQEIYFKIEYVVKLILNHILIFRTNAPL